MTRPVTSSRTIPFAVTEPDRIPAQRYYDKEFYELECELLWPRVWQMACRLEEIPQPGSFSAVGYRALWTLCGVAIGVLVMLLADVLVKRTAKPSAQRATQPEPRSVP